MHTFKFKDLYNHKSTFHEVKDFSMGAWSIKATLDEGLGFNFPGTTTWIHLKQN
jgi:hypothetical protein